MIEFKKVCKHYYTGEKDYTVLDNITFSVARGEYLLVTGKSGSGKSTLLNILGGVDTASEGEVLVDGRDILRLGENEMTRWRGEQVGIVFQFFQLIPTLSALENILLAMDLIGRVPKAERLPKAVALLKMVGLGAHASKMPSALSGGEQQRVAIARALANDAPLLIADEPTGNLDSKNADMVFAILEKLHEEGKTIVMVTHEKEAIRGATRKIVIGDGCIREDFPLQGGVAR